MLRYLIFLFICFVFICGCSPSIHSFNVSPLTISEKDSIRVDYKVRGKPVLLIHEQKAPLQNENSTRYLELTLIAQKGNKEKKQMVQVSVLPDEGQDFIDFPCRLVQDTLIAAGEKSVARWGHLYVIKTISSASGRSLTVRHDGKIGSLDAEGTPSSTFRGSPLEGTWELRYYLKQAERTDRSSLPIDLKIQVLIKHR